MGPLTPSIAYESNSIVFKPKVFPALYYLLGSDLKTMRPGVPVLASTVKDNMFFGLFSQLTIAINYNDIFVVLIYRQSSYLRHVRFLKYATQIETT